MVAEGVHKVGLAKACAPVDNQGIERSAPGIVAYGKSRRSRKLIAVALDEILEGIAGIQVTLGNRLVGLSKSRAGREKQLRLWCNG
jgi:hypothetical protein